MKPMLRKAIPIQFRIQKKKPITTRADDPNQDDKKEEKDRSEEKDGGDEKDDSKEGAKEEASNDDPSAEAEEDLSAELIWTSGAPVLDSHNTNSVEDILGVVESAYLDGEAEARVGRAKVRFSPRESVRGIYQDIRAGIIRNASVGYRIYSFEEETTDENGDRVKRANKWEPVELSICPIGSDDRAGFRKMETKNMGQEMKINENEVITRERTRGIEIRSAVKLANFSEDLADDLITRGVGIDEARKTIFEKLAERSKATAPATSVISPGSIRRKCFNVELLMLS